MKTPFAALAVAAATLATTTVATPAHAAGCPAPGDIVSFNSDDAAAIIFLNGTNRPLRVYWLDFRGDAKFYRELQPGEAYRQQTYLTHPWVGVDPSGNCVGGVFMASRPGDNRITFSDR